MLKICATLENDLPEKSVAMHRRKLPATVLVPGIIGWLCQVNSFRQLGFVHSALINDNLHSILSCSQLRFVFRAAKMTVGITTGV